MDTTNVFISTGMSAGLYIGYKVAQRYYFRSGCHNNILEIAIVDKEAEEKEKEKPPSEPKVELTEIIVK
jgi:hypothetical protein